MVLWSPWSHLGASSLPARGIDPVSRPIIGYWPLSGLYFHKQRLFPGREVVRTANSSFLLNGSSRILVADQSTLRKHDI